MMGGMLRHLVCGVFVIVVICGAVASSCSSCEANACEPPQGCLAGIVKDVCDCCFVCGRKEGERCDSEELNLLGFGKCGDHLECRVRNDLDWDDPPEAVCFCTSENPLCGSDGVTYENICQLTEARYRRRDGLRAVAAEPCVKTPQIVTAPQNVQNSTGSSAAMRCEATGWPVPTIQWLTQRDSTLQKLPGNSSRVAVQSRSDSDGDETTSWLLFLRISQDDEGSYVCKAENHVGSATATATLSIQL